MLCYTEKMWFV